MKVIGRRQIYNLQAAAEAEQASYLPASTSPIWRLMPQGLPNSSTLTLGAGRTDSVSA